MIQIKLKKNLNKKFYQHQINNYNKKFNNYK